ncbi:MAG: Bax protein [Oceanicoccus sp.]|jgi:Bax protein
MSRHNSFFLVIVVIAIIYGFYRVSQPSLDGPSVEPGYVLIGNSSLPDFNNYQQVDDKKQAFFDFMRLLINQENTRVTVLRNHLQKLSTDPDNLSDAQKNWLLELAEFYWSSEQSIDAAFFNSLLQRVDAVPVSLVLAQSANESAWGTSRFATKGNNLFGQWCFETGCGMVPAGREDGDVHEVASFKSPLQSVQAYIYNLNTHAAYIELRALRANQRLKKQALSGVVLAQGLSKYSSRGDAYIVEIQKMISFNKLSQYDVL